MKVVVSCDELTRRDHVTEIIEAVLEVFDKAEIYTLVHKQRAILGKIEMRRIFSTFLSNKVKSKNQLHENSFLVPSASKNLFIPCSVDLIINISNGYSQGIKKCEKTKQITYLYSDESLKRKPGSFKEKLFSLFTKSWIKKSLKQADQVFVSNEALLNELSSFGVESKVMNPPFKIDDWKPIPSPLFTYDHIAVNAKGLDLEMAKKFKAYFNEKGLKFKFFGLDGHLNEMKESEEDPAFFGDRCSGELAPLLSGSCCIVDLEDSSFPLATLKALGTGRPVITLGTDSNKSFVNGEGIFYTDGNFDEITCVIEKLLLDKKAFDPKKLHAHVVKYHEIKFKADIQRKANKLLEGIEKRPENCC